jgi:hypothetical protein
MEKVTHRDAKINDGSKLNQQRIHTVPPLYAKRSRLQGWQARRKRAEIR